MAFSVLRACLVPFLLAILFTTITVSITAAEADDIDDLDLLELDLEDSSPFSSSSSSPSVVSLAQQKKALTQLTDYTASSFLATNEHVLLLGYASWCIRSAELMPEFAAAALLLQQSGIPVPFAKIDAVASQRIASLYNIKGFPTILFFTNGSDARYTGGFTRNEIAVWVKKHIGIPARTLTLVQEAHDILERNGTTVVGFFERYGGPEYEAFVSVALKEEETEFAQVDNIDLAKVMNREAQIQPPFLSVIKNEPETYVSFEGPFDERSIMTFVEVNKRPLVTTVSRHNHMRLYASPIKLQVTLFADADSSKDLLPLLQEVAKLFKGQILFLTVDTADEELSRPILMLYGLDADKPVVTAFNYKDGSKFLLEDDFTFQALQKFLEQLVSGTQKPFYKSQSFVLGEKDGVQTVVGKSFESIVFDTSKDVFLEVYTNWCATCDAASKAVDAIGRHFKDVVSLVIAKIDASANEHPLLQAEDYPSFLFYPTNNKMNPVRGPKKWSAKKLVQFIQKHATVPLTTGLESKDEL